MPQSDAVPSQKRKLKKLTRNFNDSDYPFKHERSSHPEFTSDSTTAAPTDEAEQINQDPVYNYHCARLAFGLFMADINDAIKEGDGSAWWIPTN